MHQLLCWGIFSFSIAKMIDSPHSFYGLPYSIKGFLFASLVIVLMISSRWDFKIAWPSSFDYLTTYDSLVDHFFKATTVSLGDHFFKMAMDSLSGVFLWGNDGSLNWCSISNYLVEHILWYGHFLAHMFGYGHSSTSRMFWDRVTRFYCDHDPQRNTF